MIKWAKCHSSPPHLQYAKTNSLTWGCQWPNITITCSNLISNLVSGRPRKTWNGSRLFPCHWLTNSVKMVILPKFLLLFQTILVFTVKLFFKELDRCTSMYIWNKKILCIRKKYLERQREEGGTTTGQLTSSDWSYGSRLLGGANAPLGTHGTTFLQPYSIEFIDWCPTTNIWETYQAQSSDTRITQDMKTV